MSEIPSRRPVEAIESRQSRTTECDQRVRKTVAKLSKTGLPFTVEEVCRRAGVGKTFVYDKRRPELTRLVLEARDVSQLGVTRKANEERDAKAESWRTRALNAEARVKELRQQLRGRDARISDLTGQLFDPEGNHLVDENGRLRDQIAVLSRELSKLQNECAIARRSLQASRATVLREQERSLSAIRPAP